MQMEPVTVIGGRAILGEGVACGVSPLGGVSVKDA
jgi:hypothetical protein